MTGPQPTDRELECLHCGRRRPPEEFPVGRPRADGSQHPMAYCQDCWSERAFTGCHLRGGGMEAHRRGNRESMRRRRASAA